MTSISQMSVQELEALLLDLSGRLELSVGEVDLFYQVGEELERRKQMKAEECPKCGSKMYDTPRGNKYCLPCKVLYKKPKMS